MGKQKVNLFIVGAPKCGTSSLARIFRENVNFFVPKIEEPAYFCVDKKEDSINLQGGKNFYFPTDNLDKYEKHYKSSKGQAYLVDKSVDYLDSAVAARLIYEYNPNAKIIVCLRPHEEYVISLYHEMVKSAGELPQRCEYTLNAAHIPRSTLPPFLRSRMDIDYIGRSNFCEMLSRYYDCFPAENILLLSFSKFTTDPQYLKNKLENFLKVDIFINHIPIENIRTPLLDTKGLRLYFRLRQSRIRKFLPIPLKRWIGSALRAQSTSKEGGQKICLSQELMSVFEKDRTELASTYDFEF